MIILGVDLGKARTGVAVCDKREMLASPVEVVYEHNRTRLLERVAAIAKARGAEQIVVGLPRNMDGSEGPRAEKARQFAALLRALDVPEVLLRDERRTSVEAHAILRANGRREKRHRQNVDAVAAQLILETFLGSAENARLQRGD